MISVKDDYALCRFFQSFVTAAFSPGILLSHPFISNKELNTVSDMTTESSITLVVPISQTHNTWHLFDVMSLKYA